MITNIVQKRNNVIKAKLSRQQKQNDSQEMSSQRLHNYNEDAPKRRTFKKMVK